MKWIIDRFEGDFAVVECEKTYFNVPKDALPDGALEGSIIELEINMSETENKTKQLQKRLNNLFGE